MTDCFVYDTVRTPRGKGKKDGALHEVTALELATQALRAVRDRNHLISIRQQPAQIVAHVGIVVGH